MEDSTPLATLNTESSRGTRAGSDVGHHKRRNGGEPLTVSGYSQAVRNFADLVTGAGDTHRRLADILRLGPSGSYCPSQHIVRVVNYYRFTANLPESIAPESAKGPAPSKPTFTLGLRQEFPTCKAFHDFEPPAKSDSPGQLLFLRGHLSAEWIGLIGSKYRVDPEFFSQVLDFRSPDDRTNNFSTPGLPGVTWNVIKLPLMTVGSRDPMKRDVGKYEINEIRADSVARMRRYHDELGTYQTRAYNPIPVGNSYVRNYHVFDEISFALEQSLTICLQPAEGRSGWTALVWSDVGITGFEQGYLDGPWSEVERRLRSQHTLVFPVICNKPNTALFSHKISPEKRSTHDLHVDYGRSMRQELMAQDAFYALHEVFLHSACSERQFLNLVDSKLTKAIEEARNLDVDSLPSLNYLKEILYHHLKYNRHVASFIKSLEHSRWPQLVGEKPRRRNSVVLDHSEHLATQAQMLYSRCEGAITVLMNSISIAEARKSISQAERLGRLTFLAFIFVPLSFTTSVFSMNLKEISQPHLPSLRDWFALTIPVMAFALLLFYLNVGEYTRRMVARPQAAWRDLRLRMFDV